MSQARIRLLEADPDLGRYLSNDDLAGARGLSVPVLTFAREDEESLERRLEEHGGFAGLLLEGMVLEQLQIGDQVGLRLLGPGDIVTAPAGAQSMLIDGSRARVVAGTRLAVMGRDFLLGSQRWPALIRGVHLRLAQQAERLAAQLVVCQLPRVDQRLLALMWLLAESWGRVTPSGTTLPLKLTHDALGALIGARRPTVTLALRDLAERGAIVRQDTGWLLLETPAGALGALESLPTPSLIDDRQGAWADRHADAASGADPAEVMDRLTQRLATLRERHDVERDTFAERMHTLAGVRQRCRESRARVEKDRLSRRRTRSS